jgi:thiamine kinase-like enzyme
MTQLITAIEQVTPDLLTQVLRSNGFLEQGQVLDVAVLPSLPGASTITPIKLTYSQESSAPGRMILKLPHETNRANKREVEFYAATVGLTKTLPIVRCYDAIYDDTQQSFHLLLEDLSQSHDSNPPSFLPPTIPDAERIIDALTEFHAFWWNNSMLGSVIGQLPTRASIQQNTADMAETFSRFVDFLGDRFAEKHKAMYETLLAKLPDLLSHRLIGASNLTLIHDDLHAGNFLYPHDPTKDRIRLIDWKSWSINPGVGDLSNMMCVYWIRERRQALQDILLLRYHRQLMERGIKAYDWNTCWNDYRLSVIDHLFFPVWQWSVGTPDFIWWHNLERLITAFDDLNCSELL